MEPQLHPAVSGNVFEIDLQGQAVKNAAPKEEEALHDAIGSERGSEDGYYEDQVEDLKNIITHLKNDLTHAKVEILKAKQEGQHQVLNVTDEHEIQKLRQNNAKLEESVAKLKKMCEESEIEIQRLKERECKLVKDAQLTATEVAELRDKSFLLEAKCEVSEETVKHFMEAKASRERRVKQIMEQQLANEANENKQKIKELGMKLRAVEQEKIQLQLELNTQLQELTFEKEILMAEKGALTSRILDQHLKAQRAIRVNEDKLTVSEGKVEQLTKEMAGLEEDNRKLLGMVEELKSSSETNVSEEVTGLREDLVASLSESCALGEKVQELNQLLIDVRESCEAKDIEISALSEDLKEVLREDLDTFSFISNNINNISIDKSKIKSKMGNIFTNRVEFVSKTADSSQSRAHNFLSEGIKQIEHLNDCFKRTEELSEDVFPPTRKNTEKTVRISDKFSENGSEKQGSPQAETASQCTNTKNNSSPAEASDECSKNPMLEEIRSLQSQDDFQITDAISFRDMVKLIGKRIELKSQMQELENEVTNNKSRLSKENLLKDTSHLRAQERIRRSVIPRLLKWEEILLKVLPVYEKLKGETFNLGGKPYTEQLIHDIQTRKIEAWL
eukprot:Nk52_evm54s252 gene=Nk52_evmTU54s252